MASPQAAGKKLPSLLREEVKQINVLTGEHKTHNIWDKRNTRDLSRESSRTRPMHHPWLHRPPETRFGGEGGDRGTLQTRQPSRCRFTYVHPWGFCVCCIPYLTRRRPEYANRAGGWICGEVFVKSTIIDSIRSVAKIASGNERPTFSSPSRDILEKYFISLSNFYPSLERVLRLAKRRHANF